MIVNKKTYMNTYPELYHIEETNEINQTYFKQCIFDFITNMEDSGFIRSNDINQLDKNNIPDLNLSELTSTNNLNAYGFESDTELHYKKHLPIIFKLNALDKDNIDRPLYIKFEFRLHRIEKYNNTLNHIGAFAPVLAYEIGVQTDGIGNIINSIKGLSYNGYKNQSNTVNSKNYLINYINKTKSKIYFNDIDNIYNLNICPNQFYWNTAVNLPSSVTNNNIKYRFSMFNAFFKFDVNNGTWLAILPKNTSIAISSASASTFIGNSKIHFIYPNGSFYHDIKFDSTKVYKQAIENYSNGNIVAFPFSYLDFDNNIHLDKTILIVSNVTTANNSNVEYNIKIDNDISRKYLLASSYDTSTNFGENDETIQLLIYNDEKHLNEV